jgi:tetratricopeptide (TPR) repeat protein
VLYEIWREPIRWLSLEAQLDDLEASVLKTLVPDINRLLERDVPDAPELDAQSAQDRLLNVIENLIRSQQHPLVIILEDLHWISSESLKVLSRLIRGIENLPILIVASYRDDEAPKLPNQLPFMQVIKLHRLPPDDIAALSESMLGEAGRAEHIVEFLNRETEGNVFFIVEVVRTLAEEAGTLHDIAHKTLPQSVFAGGMQRIVQRRLNRVPKDAHLLLQAMAVAGRRLDLRLLQTVKNQHPDIYSRYLETWLEVCSNAAVLEVQDGEWRFAHDKLREGLLANLSPDETRRINRQVAEALEVLYADNPAYAAALADHWYKADESPKAIHYLDLAGAQAVASFANQEAIMYLARAQELDEAVPTRDNLLRRAYRESLLGQACLGAGRLEDSRTHLRKALALLKQPIPPSKRRLILSLLGQVAVQIEHRLIPSRLARFDEAGGADLLEAARIYEKMAELFYFQGDDVSTLYCSIRTLNMAERVEPSPELARAYGNLTVATGLVGLHNLSKVYHQRAQDIVARIDNIQTQSRVMSRTALAASGRGELSIADPLIRRSVELAEQIGDPRQWGEANAIYLNILYLQGKFEQSRHLCAQLLEHGTRRGDSQHRHWGMMWGMMNALALDLVDEAEALSLQALEYLAESSIPKLDEILERGFIALVWLRRGRLEEARGMVDRAFPLGVIIPHASSFAQCEAFASKAQVYLTLLDLTPEPDPRLLAEAQGGVRVIQAYAKRFAIGEPRAGKLAGWLEIHQGNPGKAHAIWEKALARALEFQLPYEQAHLHYQIGRHLPKGDPHRREHLQQAVELYTRLGNPYRAGLAEME